MNLWKPAFSSLLSLFLPRYCISCGALSENDGWLCETCEKLLKSEKAGYSPEIIDADCNLREERYFDSGIALFPFHGVARSFIHALKYDGFTKSGTNIVFRARHDIEKFAKDREIDGIIAVPLHKIKHLNRGFNQAEVLAESIADITNWTVLKRVVIRSVNTKSQSHLSAEERQENVAEAFTLFSGAIVRNKRFVLVDDVFTTGATINSMARVLKRNGADRVFVLTATKAVK
ncbi:MAG: ComF family protein [Candidatus Cloacimonetes bacterium]|nr:ComF family protein [Candidatus Cloacimonadota bacterium]